MASRKELSHSSQGLMHLVFNATLVLLKLTGVIDWSWWAVTSPLWGGLLTFIAGGMLANTLYAMKSD